jgi:hypothetical protein
MVRAMVKWISCRAVDSISSKKIYVEPLDFSNTSRPDDSMMQSERRKLAITTFFLFAECAGQSAAWAAAVTLIQPGID